jgi:hypothetical protein
MINKCFWTHADGKTWWGRYTHLADLDVNGNLLPDTEWKIEVTNRPSLENAQALLDTLSEAKLCESKQIRPI